MKSTLEHTTQEIQMNESQKYTNGRETIRLELSDNKRKTLIVSLEDMEDMENLEDIDPEKSLPFLLHPDPDNEPTKNFFREKLQCIFEKEEHSSQDTDTYVRKESQGQSLPSKQTEEISPTNTTKLELLRRRHGSGLSCSTTISFTRSNCQRDQRRTTTHERLLLQRAMITGKIRIQILFLSTN